MVQWTDYSRRLKADPELILLEQLQGYKSELLIKMKNFLYLPIC